jgi:hypothetical protein
MLSGNARSAQRTGIFNAFALIRAGRFLVTIGYPRAAKGQKPAYELAALKTPSRGDDAGVLVGRVRDPLCSAREVTIESIEPCLLLVVKRAVKLLECGLNCFGCCQ